MVRAGACAATARESQRCLVTVLLGLLFVAGCRSSAPEPITDPESPRNTPEPVAEPAPAPPEPDEPKPTPEPVEPEPADPLRLAILLSDGRPEYASVGDALLELAGPDDADLFPLEGAAGQMSRVFQAVNQGGYDRVVAVGLRAAQASKTLDSIPVVFCQVINHRENGLLRDGVVGVSAIAPLDDAIRAWKKLNPQLVQVGVVSGSGHEDTIAAARQAMAVHGVELTHAITASDKETVYEFRRLVGRIQGYWLFPDNRVLSRSAFTELMSLARRARVQVLVNDVELLEQGALLSASTDPQDIAERVFEQLHTSYGKDPEGLISLRRCRVGINGKLASKLGIELDESLQPLLAR